MHNLFSFDKDARIICKNTNFFHRSQGSILRALFRIRAHFATKIQIWI
jgi:hypothetical protein